MSLREGVASRPAWQLAPWCRSTFITVVEGLAIIAARRADFACAWETLGRLERETGPQPRSLGRTASEIERYEHLWIASMDHTQAAQ